VIIKALYDDVYREVAKATRGDRIPTSFDLECEYTDRSLGSTELAEVEATGQ